jgi:nucleotide-binding universal stress UspA family protein
MPAAPPHPPFSARILVGVEGEHEGRDAVALGVLLARALDASLLLAGVYSTVLGASAYAYEMAGRQEVEVRLRDAARAIPASVRHETRAVPSTSVVRGLHELAERTAAELIVVGPTHRGRARRALGGDVTLGLLQAAPCAVAVAPAGYADGEPHPAVVGVGYLPTPEGREALDAGIALADRLGARLRVLVAGPRTEDVERLLDEARLEAPTGLDVETVLLDGVEPDRLLRLASEDLGLLVMGSRGYGPTRRVLLGSVSAGVVHGAACPVLVLPRGAAVPSRAEVRA